MVFKISSNRYLKNINGFTIITPAFFCINSIVLFFIFLFKAINIIPVGLAYVINGGLIITVVTFFGIFKYNHLPSLRVQY